MHRLSDARPQTTHTAPQPATDVPRGIRLPVFRAVTDTDTRTVPPYVTVVGVIDRTRDSLLVGITTVPEWREIAPDPQAPPVVAVLRPKLHLGDGTAIPLSTVQLEAVEIEADNTITLADVRFAGLLVGTVNRRWDHYFSPALGYPSPPAVQLWHHAR